jgi:hypothetical protein
MIFVFAVTRGRAMTAMLPAPSISDTAPQRLLQRPLRRISDARDSLDGPADLDQGIKVRGKANIVPTDDNGIAFSRTPGQVLNIVYLNPAAVTEGGFFPEGVNGEVNTSDSND